MIACSWCLLFVPYTAVAASTIDILNVVSTSSLCVRVRLYELVVARNFFLMSFDAI